MFLKGALGELLGVCPFSLPGEGACMEGGGRGRLSFVCTIHTCRPRFHFCCVHVWRGWGAGGGAPHALPTILLTAYSSALYGTCMRAGAVVFTYGEAGVLEEACLMPEPRSALHAALVQPSSVLGSGVVDE